jgi:hypothetical protein
MTFSRVVTSQCEWLDLLVGWRERDYARFNEAERRVFYGGDRHKSQPRSRSFFKPGVGLAMLVSVAIFLVGHYPTSHPLIPALSFKLPSLTSVRGGSPVSGSASELPSQSFPLQGPRTARYRSTLILAGSVTSVTAGLVSIEGHWNARPWQSIASTQLATDHSWRASLLMNHQGMLNLRVILPDGNRLIGSIRVTP